MRVLALHGSPRITGNTTLLTRSYINGILESHTDALIDEVYLIDQTISPCSGCNGCKSGSGKCVLRDDMDRLYTAVRKADVMIFSTPVYWWHMSAKLKVFVDRLYAMDFSRDFKDKKLILISTFGGTADDSGYKIICDSLEHMSEFLGMEFIHRIGVSTGTTPVRENTEALDHAKIVGKSL